LTRLRPGGYARDMEASGGGDDAGAGARERVTLLVEQLGSASAGRAPSSEELFRVLYDELRQLARTYMSRERDGHTLRPTALVHEAYLRLVDEPRVNWQGRTHFFMTSARVMRHILVDHARSHASQKRGGEWHRVTLDEAVIPDLEAGLGPAQFLSLHDALDRLGRLDDRQARVVEMKFFSGMNVDEIARILDVSPRTVELDWAHAKAWLRRELARGAPE